MKKEEMFPVNRVTSREDLPEGFLDFLVPLHKRYSGWASIHAARRYLDLRLAHIGNLPSYSRGEREAAERPDWKITLPDWCQDQRNQMAGPADDAELVVKMLNSGASGVVIDLEDSLANYWPNLKAGIRNAVAALQGTLTYRDKNTEQEVGIKDSKTARIVRVRGLHIFERGLHMFHEDLDDNVSAPLFDLALLAYKLDASKLQHPLCLYIPKSESGDEARWWSAVLEDVARAKGWPEDYIKCMALVESHPLAYEMESFIWNLRRHILALNLGRWDYMASLAHFNLRDPDWVLPDRNTIPHDAAYLQRLRELLVHVCHKRGILAIGGMTALFPSWSDSKLNKRALKELVKDKRNESEIGLDGAWTGHPDQNEIAVSAFPYPNQLYRVETRERFPDLRPELAGVGQTTLEGTAEAVRTCIRYRYGVLSGRGASLLNGRMEYLATDRIYRLMIAQRVKHQVGVEVNPGAIILHTPRLITALFDQELEKILQELPDDVSREIIDRCWEASRLTQEMIRRGQFDPH